MDRVRAFHRPPAGHRADLFPRRHSDDGPSDLLGVLAIFDRLCSMSTARPRRCRLQAKVAVLIPAYNEEKVIERTVGALDSDYPNLRVIVIDDGSKTHSGGHPSGLCAEEAGGK